MFEDYFLIVLGLIGVVFATFQDLKTREVANWLNYSLIGVGLIFRLGFSLSNGDWNYLFYGLIGLGAMYCVGNAFYYSQAFAGGDAKLLMALGVLFPYQSYGDLIVYDVGFVLLLLILGLVYTLAYSALLALRHFRKYSKEFYSSIWKNKWIFVLGWILGLLLVLLGKGLLGYVGAIVFILPVIYCHLKSVEEACLIVELKPGQLTEGEWLNEDVKIRGKWIRKTVHGLTKEEIKWILKHGRGKKIEVKQGIPFVPVFLLSFLVMGYAFLFLLRNPNLLELVSSVL